MILKSFFRSAEELFSLFIAIAFTVESIRAIHYSFRNNYYDCDENYEEKAKRAVESLNVTNSELGGIPCQRDTSILYMLLMFGTLWLALFLYNFRKTPYLTRSRREWLADYALPASVLIMSFAGAYLFSEIDSKII